MSSCDTEGFDDFWRTLMLHELAKAARTAYAHGVTREEAQAICGAAYGDWNESKEERSSDSTRPSSPLESHDGYQPGFFDEYW